MAKRFIRWILPLLVVMTIAIAFVFMALPGTHAAAPVKTTVPVSAPAKTTGISPNYFWGP